MGRNAVRPGARPRGRAALKPASIQIARHRLERARSALRDGETLLAQESLTGAGNRFYYAAFYAARAVLATRELNSSRHSGVIALFQKHFVKTKVFNPAVAKALPRAFENRQKCDYEDFAALTPEEAQQLRNSAFVMRLPGPGTLARISC